MVTEVRVYPRLARDVADQLLADTATREDAGEPLWNGCVSHPAAAPASLSKGRVVGEDELLTLRDRVVMTADQVSDGPVGRSNVSTWDRAIGRVLAEHLLPNPADRASDDFWSFLTLVVLPDLSARRFPLGSPNRHVGTPRNTFRRVWERAVVLRDIDQGDRPLGEDELTGLFERSALARNHRLLRATAAEILKYDGGDRSDFARKLNKRIRFQAGARVLDLLSDEGLDHLVQECGRAARQDDHRHLAAGSIFV